MSLIDYYMSYGKIAKAIGFVLAAIPFVSNIPPKEWTGYAFPPLGPFSPLAQILTVALGLIATLIAYSAAKIRPTKSLSVTALLFALCIVLYGWSFSLFSREVPIQSEDKKVWVSVGWERTPFVSDDPKLTKLNDWDLLHNQGWTEDRIEKLWTKPSLFTARFLLWAPYSGLLFIAFFILGMAVIFSAQAGGSLANTKSSTTP